ncbi:MAG: rhomboid family intramembrane serine protease [Myxococcota bacterium]
MPAEADGPEPRLPAKSRAEAEAWSLVLAAEGIAHGLLVSEGRFSVEVDEADAVRARALLERWARENAPAPAAPPAAHADVPTNAGIWIALALVGFFAVTGAWSDTSEYFRLGAADARRIATGFELWRTVTALTLHSDPAHVLGNAFSCAVFGTLLLRRYGVGVGAWLLLGSGALGNLLTALWHGSQHRSVGASTALFGAIGALAATELVRRRRLRLGWNQAWLPIAGGVALLAMLGTGRGSDFGAHVTGLAAGAALGVAAAHSLTTLPAFGTQAALALGAVAVIAAAWAAALS